MPEIKQPTIKGGGLPRNVTNMATPVTPPPAEREKPAPKLASKEAPTQKVVTQKVVPQKAAAPARKKTVRKKPAAAPKKTSAASKTARTPAAASAGKSVPRAAAAQTRPTLSRDARQSMINDAAYLISVKRHAGVDGPEADWLYAETVVDMAFDIKD